MIVTFREKEIDDQDKQGEKEEIIFVKSSFP